jgi:hypothetical protein
MADIITMPLDSILLTQSTSRKMASNRFTITSSAVKYEDNVYAADDSVIRKRTNAHLHFENLSTNTGESVSGSLREVIVEE